MRECVRVDPVFFFVHFPYLLVCIAAAKYSNCDYPPAADCGSDSHCCNHSSAPPSPFNLHLPHTAHLIVLQLDESNRHRSPLKSNQKKRVWERGTCHATCISPSPQSPQPPLANVTHSNFGPVDPDFHIDCP